MAVRIMAIPAANLALLETLGALERFDNEGGLAESAVLVEAFAGELPKRDALTTHEELASGRIIQFTMQTGGANRGLHVTLRTDCNKIAVPDSVEIDRGVKRIRQIKFSLGHLCDVLSRRSVTSFTIDSRLLKLQILRLKAPALDVPQLAGVADGANRLITGRTVQLLPGTQI